MWEEILIFFENTKNIWPLFVGCIAFLVYILQERRKVSEAASLIVLQIEDLKGQIKKINSYIIDKKLNDAAFYESQILFQKDYWNEYKHYFVKKWIPVVLIFLMIFIIVHHQYLSSNSL